MLLKKRVISGLILLPVIVLLVFLGGWPYWVLVAVVTLTAGYEYSRMFRRRSYSLNILLIWLTILTWEIGAVWSDRAWLLPLFTLAVLLTTLWELIHAHNRPEREHPAEAWALTLAGALYLGIGGYHLIRLRALPDGFWWAITTFVVVWVGDSAAYCAGNRWGQHKMAPTISPGKSWEGYGAQIVAGVLIGLFMGWLWPTLLDGVTMLNPLRGLLIGAVVSVFSPAGDFFVSMIKREVDVKDTSNLIPGHGGILDRIDSIVWAGILVHLLSGLWLS